MPSSSAAVPPGRLPRWSWPAPGCGCGSWSGRRFPRFHIGESLLPRNLGLLRELGLLEVLEGDPQGGQEGGGVHPGERRRGLSLPLHHEPGQGETSSFNLERGAVRRPAARSRPAGRGRGQRGGRGAQDPAPGGWARSRSRRTKARSLGPLPGRRERPVDPARQAPRAPPRPARTSRRSPTSGTSRTSGAGRGSRAGTS